VLGGGAGNVNYNPLEDRPPAAVLGGHVLRSGGAWTRRPTARWFSLRARGVSCAELRVSAEAESVRVRNRVLPVPGHGHQIVVWATRRAPVAEVYAPGSVRLAAIDLGRHAL
jgi:hypothetical protein